MNNGTEEPAAGTLEAFEEQHGKLLPAEVKLVAAYKSGEWCIIVDPEGHAAAGAENFDPRASDRPVGPTAANSIRAELLRALILRKFSDQTPHEKGVQLSGAWIAGKLDLAFCKIELPLVIVNSTFAERPDLLQSRLPFLNLTGSWLCDGLGANGASIDGPVFLRDGFRSDGEVDFRGATIGGRFHCAGGRFRKADGIALHANGAEVGVAVFLSAGFEAQGQVSFRGAKIGMDLACVGGRFEGTEEVIDLQSAEIGGRLLLRQPSAIGEEATWPRTVIDGPVDLGNARCRVLADNALDATPERFRIGLDGFLYQQIVGPTSFAKRKAWLLRQPPDDLGVDFKPQPFEQLARVLRETGHEEDARRLAVLKRKSLLWAELLRAQWEARDLWSGAGDGISKLKRAPTISWLLLVAYLRGLGSCLFLATLGFGYRPQYALGWSVMILLLGALVFGRAYEQGVMTPNNAVILRSPEWTDCVDREKAVTFAPNRRNATQCWLEKQQGRDFQRFQSLAYSLDVFLPLFDLHQEANWIPQPERAGGNVWLAWTRLYQWIHTGLGYLLSALAVAGFTGIVKKE